MTDPRKPIFDAVKAATPGNPFNDRNNLDLLDAVLTAIGVPKPEKVGILKPRPAPKPEPSPAPTSKRITVPVALELLKHEGIVREAYRDVVGVWTWGVGVTKASGIDPLQYKDKPASIETVLRAYVGLLGHKYLPAVLRAFDGYVLREHQLAAALSFHYNTGGIARASWVSAVKIGDNRTAERKFMAWSKPAAIIERRRKEQRLFFHGEWSRPESVMVYQVSKPGYRPTGGKRMNITTQLEKVLGEA